MRTSAVVFALVVALCLAQVTWWIYFQFRETGHLAQAAELLDRGEVAAAQQVLGVDRVARRRIMFASEGAALGLCVLIGVVFFYTALLRERRIRRDHERFLTGATHELKSPLATIRLGLESILTGGVPADKEAKYLAAMVQEVDRLERGLGNLLAAGGLRHGERTLTLTRGDLADDLCLVVDELRARFEAAGIELRMADLPAVELLRDASAIHIVLHNLLDNAVKYSPRGAAVTITLRQLGDGAELSVADTGQGMNQADLARAFEPFYRGTQRAHVGGSGLGLHLVRELVALHGGTVEAHSDGPGRGSELVVRLPEQGASP